MKTASLVVLISGDGSNLQAIIDAIKARQIDARIDAVISNVADAGGLERARRENIPTHVIDHKDYGSRESFDAAMIEIIDAVEPQLVILAGFMRILSELFIRHYAGRLINIHPSLLPRYKGLNTHQQAIDNKDKIHGASVHYVSHELDSGPVVLQTEVDVDASDDAATLAARVLRQEHIIYPMAIKLHLDGRIQLDDERLLLDGNEMKTPLLWKNNQLIGDG